MRFLKSRALAAATLLSSSFLSAPTDAQTWALRGNMYPPSSVTGAVSDGGRFALIATPEAESFAEVVLAPPTGDVTHQYSLRSETGAGIRIFDAIFVGESALAIAGSIDSKPWMGMLDADTGTAHWDQSFELTGHFESIAFDSNGTFLLSGRGSTSLTSFVAALGGAGHVKWTRHLTFGDEEVYAGDALPLAGFDSLVTYHVNGELFVSRHGFDGSLLWVRRFDGPDSSIRPRAAVELADGTLVIGADRYFLDGSRRDLVLWLDADGTPIRTRSWAMPGPNAGAAFLTGLDAYADGSLVVGTRSQDLADAQLRESAVVRLSDTGDLLWAQSYAASADGAGATVQALPDGGFAAFTRTTSNQARLLRGDATGTVGDCSAPLSLQVDDVFLSSSADDLSESSVPFGTLELHSTTGPASITTSLPCSTPCQVAGSTYGSGTPGTFGIVPSLSVTGGHCLTWGPTLELELGLGGAIAVFGLSPVGAELPLLGGTVYVDPATTVFVPVFLSGTPGAAGMGSAELVVTGDLSLFAGTPIHAQAFVLDTGAAEWLSMTRAGLLTVQ